MFLFLREGGYWLAWAGFDDPVLTCMFSDWKQSALRFLTRPRLGQGAMGLSEDSLVMKKHNEQYLYFYYLLIVYTMLERLGARGGDRLFFSCPNCTWSMRWSVMVWDVIFIGQSPNPFFFFSFLPYSFSLRCSLYSAPAKFQFLIGYTAPCTVILLIFIVLPARRVPGLRQSNLISNHYLEVGNQA